MSEDKKKNKKSRISLIYVLSGGMLTEDFFVKNTKLILFIVLLFFGYITNRYDCLSKIKDIDKLQQEFNDVRNEAIAVSIQLTTKTRPSQVEELVERQNLGLERAHTPPYRLHK